jgi:hypothetical protein
MAIDYSDYSDLIPEKTIAIVQMRVRSGDGTDGVLKRTKAGDGEGLDVEFMLLNTDYAKRKLFAFILLIGTTDGQKQMCERNGVFLKQIVDSAKFLDPNDKSPEARKARTMNYRDFDGLRFLAEIGVEQGRNGYPDKNVIIKAITKDRAEWGNRAPIDQIAPDMSAQSRAAAEPTAGKAATTPAPIKKPEWAK